MLEAGNTIGQKLLNILMHIVSESNIFLVQLSKMISIGCSMLWDCLFKISHVQSSARQNSFPAP